MGERRIINGAIYEKADDGTISLIGPAPAVSAAPTAVPLPVNPVRAAKEAQENARKDRTEGRQNAAAERQASAAERQAGATEHNIQNQNQNNLMQLRSAYENTPVVKEYRVGISSLGAALSRPGDPTGDTSLIYDYAKAMDPGSVVRESEMGMAASGASMIDAAVAGYKKRFGIEGGGGLSPEVRERLKREIAHKVAAQNKQYSAQRNRYANDAKNMGFDPANVIGNHDGDVFMPQIKEYEAQHGGAEQKADNEVPGQDNGADTKPAAVAASGDTRYESNDRLKSKVDSLISAGSFETANAVLRKEGLPPISPVERQKIVQWQKANPGKAYTASQIGRDVPLTAFQSLAGSPLGAGAARFANSATAGLVGAAAGAKGQGALDAMAAAHPDASVLGDVTGGVLGAMGAEGAIAARLAGRGAAWLPAVLGDAGYGGLSGFNNAQEGEGGMGALTGAAAGVGGGLLGKGAARVAGATFRGVQNPAARYLRDQGIPLTVGQTVGDSGTLGRTIKGAEDAMTSIPGVGSMVNARRLEGMEGFNQAAFRQAGVPINAQVGATGADGIQALRGEVGNAYDNALGGTQINTQDPAFLADMQGVINNANAIPPVNGAREAAATALDARIMGGTDEATGIMPGRNFQEAYRGLARTGRERANGDYGHEIGQVMRQGQDALAGALEAQNPGAFTAFRAANSAHRNTSVLADAVHRAKNAEQELFTPAQLNMADAGSTRRLSGPLASASGDRPFYDLTQAGQAVLPSKLPDSGTATRGMVGLGILGAGAIGGGAGATVGQGEVGGGVGLGTALLLAAGGSRPAQRFLTNALMDRPDLAVNIGQALSRNARMGGWTGAGVLTPLTVGQ